MATTDTSPADSAQSALVESFWEQDSSVELVDFTVGGLLAERASTHAHIVALVGTRHGDGLEQRLTYSELYEAALRVATAILDLVEEGDFVALWAPNVVEWPIIQYGAALAGVILVALNPGLRGTELAYAIDHSRASVLIHADRNRNYDMAEVVA